MQLNFGAALIRTLRFLVISSRCCRPASSRCWSARSGGKLTSSLTSRVFGLASMARGPPFGSALYTAEPTAPLGHYFEVSHGCGVRGRWRVAEGEGAASVCTQPPWPEVRSLNLARVRTVMPGRCPCVREDCLCKRHARRGERCQARTATSGLCAACRDNVPASSNGQGSFAAYTRKREFSQPATASADPSAVFEPPPIVDRPRVTRKGPPPEVPLVIHHIKIVLRSRGRTACSSTITRLDEVELAAVRSHGAPQVIWSYDSVEIPKAHPNVVRLCDARMLLAEGQFNFLVRKGIPLAYIKDPRTRWHNAHPRTR